MKRAWPLAVFAATAAAYLPCLLNVLQWDDLELLLQPALASPFPDLWRFIWSNTVLGHYTPVAWLSWAADRALWGGAPWGYHLTNILLHGANAVLAAFLARRVLRRAAPDLDDACATAGAVAAAFFFSLHPLRVEVVAWATERRGLLSALFGMGAALCHERFVEGRGRAWPAPLLLAAAVLSKETAVMWPPVLTCWRWMCGRKDARELPGLAALWLVGTLGGLAGLAAVHHQSIALAWTDYGPVERLVQVLRCPVWAALKTLWPAGLSPLYELSYGGALPTGRWAAAAAGGAFTAAALAALRARPSLAWAWVVQFLFLLPTSGVFQSGPQDTADRYTYMACLPWCFLLGLGAARAAAGARQGRRSAARALAALFFCIGGLGLLSARQQAVWRTPFSFWERVVAVSPASAYGPYGLGVEQARAGLWEEALASFRRSLAASPAFPRALYGAGAACQKLGRKEEARSFFRLALAADPDDELVRRIPALLAADGGT